MAVDPVTCGACGAAIAPQTDEEVAEMIARFRTPPGCDWRDLRNDIVTLLKSRTKIAHQIADGDVGHQLLALADAIDNATPRYEALLASLGVQGHPVYVSIDDPVERERNLKNWRRLTDQDFHNILSASRSRPAPHHRRVAALLRGLARDLHGSRSPAGCAP